MSTHHRAWCTRCRAAWNGPDAHRLSRRHELRTAGSTVPHRVVWRSHPKQFCTDACNAEKENPT